jgi:glucosamine--fructose-6-phosphate aminotransferase (isomerizing)
MKHGPIALINCEKPKETTVIFLILDDKNLPAMKVAIDELHSRKAYIVVITDCQEKLNREKVDHFIAVPKLKVLSSLLCLIPLQLLTNEISVALGINPDKPRNLAKTVTV